MKEGNTDILVLTTTNSPFLECCTYVWQFIWLRLYITYA